MEPRYWFAVELIDLHLNFFRSAVFIRAGFLYYIVVVPVFAPESRIIRCEILVFAHMEWFERIIGFSVAGVWFIEPVVLI